MTTFVGRRHELADARRLLGTARLLTLTGMGGVGKTRLALNVARNACRAYPDGVCFVDLAPLRDADLLVPAVAAALGLDDRSSRPPLESVTAFLVDRRLLLVLDNCEHLLEPCARLAATLLRNDAGIRLLATSRQPLGIDGERVLEVPPLSLPADERAGAADGDAGLSDAVRLFEERAAQLGFTFGPDDRRTVARLVRRLDGLPLAIELAAVRLRVLSAEQILDRIGDRFALLRAGNRAAEPRQRTLRATIDWSHDLCSAPERSLWENLSVFPATFAIDAAEDVCGSGAIPREDVVGVLTGLVDKSIVLRAGDDTDVRYRMLDSIRSYGQALLAASGREPLVRRAHRDHYRAMVERAAEEWFGPRRLEWLARLRQEHPNIQAALEQSLAGPEPDQDAFAIVNATWDYWVSCGMLGEGRHWLDLALRRAPAPTPERVRALWVAGRLAMLQGDAAAARRLMRECVAAARALGDDASARAHAAEISGVAALFEGRYERAVALLEEATDGYRAAGDPPVVRMLGLYQLAWATCLLGRLDRALWLGERLLEVNEKYGADSYRFLPLWVLGLIRYRRDDLRGAAGLIREALRLQSSGDEVYGTAKGIEALAWVTAAAGAHRDAARLLGSADTLWKRVGMPIRTVAPFRDFHDRCVRRLRAALGEEAYAAAFRDGAAVPPQRAVAAALDDRRPGAPGDGADGDVSGLTRREREVAELVAQGLTNKQIAATLVIAQRTAEGHVEHILGKLGFSSRSQIASWATTRLPQRNARH